MKPERKREQYLQRIAKGLCGACGTRPQAFDKTTCQRCLDKLRTNTAIRNKKRLIAGICSMCGKRPIKSGRKRCEDCLSKGRKTAAYIRESRLAAGLCAECGLNRIEEGLHYCTKCRNRHGIYSSMLRHKSVYHAAVIRDGFICQICGSTKRPNAHHIDGNGKSLPNSKKLNPSPNDDMDNLITLCPHCHAAITKLTHAIHPEIAIFLIQKYLRISIDQNFSGTKVG